MSSLAGNKDKRNYKIQQLYVRQDFDECLKLIESVLDETSDLCEYALFTKALIMRQRGQIQDSLTLFQKATAINPHNVSNLKQVGRSLYLLGKHKAAIEVYEEAQKVGTPDWECMHNKGLCMMYLKQYDRYDRNAMPWPHDSTYIQLGKVYTLADDFPAAIQIYMEALENSPENCEILTTLGLLFLRSSDNKRAYDFLGKSLSHDPCNPRTILAAGSIIQDQLDMDSALVKYRISAVQTPNSPQLWNNIGMCFFGKQRYIAAIACLKKALYLGPFEWIFRYIAAIACLKKALYLGPFEWIIAYNLGLVHLNTEQYASAFHYLSSSINLKPDFSHSYMYLAITLNRLDDFENSCSAYEKAVQVASASDGAEFVFHLNYALTLHLHGRDEQARLQLHQFHALFDDLPSEAQNSDPDMLEKVQALSRSLNMRDQDRQARLQLQLFHALFNDLPSKAQNSDLVTCWRRSRP
eukprot:gene26319-17414_t